jgi:hypothetical protein
MNLGKDSLAIEGRTTPTMAIVTYGFNNDHPNYDCLPPLQCLSRYLILFVQYILLEPFLIVYGWGEVFSPKHNLACQTFLCFHFMIFGCVHNCGCCHGKYKKKIFLVIKI